MQLTPVLHFGKHIALKMVVSILSPCANIIHTAFMTIGAHGLVNMNGTAVGKNEKDVLGCYYSMSIEK